MVLTSARLTPENWQQDDAFEPLTDEKVIGLNNLLSIAWLSQALTLAAPVARIVVGEAWGSGFLIATDLLITNHHVLPDAETADKAIAEFNYQTDWAGNIEPVRRYTFDSAHLRTSKELDYSIVRVRDSPGDVFGFIDIGKQTEPAVNSFVSVIQHPNGGPKQICFTDNKVAAVFGDRVQYSTDTEPGSSGSPVFSQQWDIVGLHHKGGSLAGPDGTRYFTNEGILMSAILRDAAPFLSLPDALYDLAFGDLRSTLVKFVEDGQSPPDTLAGELLRTRPRFLDGLEQWGKLYGLTGESLAASTARAGVAIGAALRQWARSDGHESIKSAAMPVPPPGAGLAELVGRFKGSSGLPSDVHSAVLAALRDDPSALPPDLGATGKQDTPAAARAFLTGVALGAKAFDGVSGLAAIAEPAPAPDPAPAPAGG